MQAVDVINTVWGNDTLFFGAQGLIRTGRCGKNEGRRALPRAGTSYCR